MLGFFISDDIALKNELCVSFSKMVKLHAVRMFGGEGKKYNVKLEIFSQTTENKFHAQKKYS